MRIAVVHGPAADVACGLLRTEGIDAAHRQADVSEGWPEPGGWREILVPPEDAERARELVAAAEEG